MSVDPNPLEVVELAEAIGLSPGEWRALVQLAPSSLTPTIPPNSAAETFARREWRQPVRSTLDEE